MSTVLPALNAGSNNPAAAATNLQQKPQRVLSCLLCQQRKVKCDRKFPCSNCIKHRSQCVQATQMTRQRRRRFAERELLDRLRNYEELLRENNIKFEPLHKEATQENDAPNVDGMEGQKSQAMEESCPSISANADSERAFNVKNFWTAMKEEFRDPVYNDNSSEDDVQETMIRNVADQCFRNDDHLLFGSSETTVDISTLHPEPVQIFRLWQIYLENVDPLLKVTHTPSLQGQIIEAASSISNVRPALEALMFSIYCMAITSITEYDCQDMFGSSQSNLLANYQFGCQQALLNCGFLRTNERDCLTALYLYLVSVRSGTVPQSLSSMLGVAFRIAQRMGIHSEALLAVHPVLEAELRRRLWWSLVLFDARICEMSNSKTSMLDPTWNCKVPLNVNDTDLGPELKEVPQIQGPSSQALFSVLRCELGDVVRHSTFYLDLTAPALKVLSRDIHHSSYPDGSALSKLELIFEEKYLKFCDQGTPIHFMTVWTTRSYLARWRLVEHYSKYSSLSIQQAETQRGAAISYALKILECDTKIMASPLTQGFTWLMIIYFPFIAYVHLLRYLKQQPLSDQAERIWEILSDNYDAHFGPTYKDNSMFIKVAADILLRAWEAREAAFNQLRKSLTPPRIVVSVRHQLAETTKEPQNFQGGYQESTISTESDLFSGPSQSGLVGQGTLNSMSDLDAYKVTSSGYHSTSEPTMFDFDPNMTDWSATDWSMMNLAPGAGHHYLQK
ncbi:hypothetical protein ACMFMG_000193 [Clarireedia jacksonii]